MRGEYTNLSFFALEFTQLASCDISGASLPRLRKMWFSNNRLHSFRFPRNLTNVQEIYLGNSKCYLANNLFKEFRLGTASPNEQQFGQLKMLVIGKANINVACNNLGRLDLT